MAGLLDFFRDEQARRDMAANAMSLLQGASNGAAATVTGPVDLLAAGLRYAGVPVGQTPVGGSEWAKQRGLLTDTAHTPAGIAGETLGLLGPALVQAAAPKIASGLLNVAENLSAPNAFNAATRGQGGAIVWHGSPHRFDAFDSSKIGTGEGAQAYGHGLYLADSPTVATGYKETLTQRAKDRLMIDGKVIDPDSMLGRAAADVPRIGLQAALQKIDDNIRFNEKYAPDMADMYRMVRGKVEALNPSSIALKEGNLYKVDLPDTAIAKMLDWDKPLSQQAKNVRDSLNALRSANPQGYQRLVDAQLGGPMMDQAVGADLYRNLIKGPNERQMSGVLRQQGIPGIRYLDGGSRPATVVDQRLQEMLDKHGGNAVSAVDEFMRSVYNTPAKKEAMRAQFLKQLETPKTSNYVVFPGNENLLTILERNGQPLANLGFGQ